MRRFSGEEESGKTSCDPRRLEWLELFGQWEEESWKLKAAALCAGAKRGWERVGRGQKEEGQHLKSDHN